MSTTETPSTRPSLTADTPVSAPAPTSAKHSSIELTDQTNLLPAKTVITVFIGLSLCVVTSALDSVIVATALPTISSAFKAGSVVSWVPSAYLLTSTAFQPIYGRLSDIFGRKSTLCLAMSVFMIGNLISGFSKSIIQMIVARGVAGAGGGGIISMMQIIISDIVTLRERGKYQGVIGSVVALGYVAGPLIGGVLAEKVGWQWCFWITIPSSAVATLVVVFILPLKPVEGSMRRKLLVIDYIGSFLTLVGCSLLILPLIWGGVTFPWNSAVVLAPLFSGLFVVVVFCFWEWKGAKLPIVPMYIFKVSTVTGVYISMFINGFIFFSSLYYLSQFFQIALGYTPINSGTLLIPLVVSQMAANWIAGMIISRTGRYRAIINVGFAVWAIANGCLSTITPTTAKAKLVVFMLLAGLGGGQTMQTTTVAAQAAVDRKDMAIVTAFRNFIRMLGGTLSLAVGSTLINNSLRASMRTISVLPSTIDVVVDDPAILRSPDSIGLDPNTANYILFHGFTKGFRSLFLLHACLAVVAFLTSVSMIKHKSLTRGDEARLKQEGKGWAKEKFKRALKKGKATEASRSQPDVTTQQDRDIELGEVE